MHLCAQQLELYLVTLDGKGGLRIRNISLSSGICLNTLFWNCSEYFPNPNTAICIAQSW